MRRKAVQWIILRYLFSDMFVKGFEDDGECLVYVMAVKIFFVCANPVGCLN